MKVARADIFCVTQRSRVDTVTARGSRVETPEVFLRLTTPDGAVGWGAASPKWYITGESQESVVYALRDRLLPWLLSRHRARLSDLGSGMDGALRYNQAAKTAVDTAMHDLVGHVQGVPVHEILGSRPGHLDMSSFEVVFLGQSDDDAAEQAVRAVQSGCRHIKIKADHDAHAASTRAGRVRSAVGEGVHLSIDANQAWDVASARRVGPLLAAARIDEIEQPLHADAIGALAILRRELPVAVVVDESVCSERECREVIAAGAVDGIVLKVAKLGGIGACRRIADVAAAAGVYCVAGATLQTALLEAATAHLFVSTPNIARHEVKLLVTDDVVAGLSFEEGLLRIPTAPGLGVRVDEERLGHPVAVVSP